MQCVGRSKGNRTLAVSYGMDTDIPDDSGNCDRWIKPIGY